MSSLTIILLAPAAILVAAGVLLLVLFLLGNVMQVDVHFESTDGKWADTERTFKGYNYKLLAHAFENYQRTVKSPVSLVRTTRMEWRNVQLWLTYLLNPKWRVPYAQRTVAADQLLPTSPKPDTHAAGLVLEYFDQCAKHKHSATLVSMLGYVDQHQRVIPTPEEINEALEQRASFRVSRTNGSVIFTLSGSERAVTAADVNYAYEEYRRKFRANLARVKQ